MPLYFYLLIVECDPMEGALLALSVTRLPLLTVNGASPVSTVVFRAPLVAGARHERPSFFDISILYYSAI